MSISDLQEAKAYLESIDFSPIIERIKKEKKWHSKKIVKAVEEYKKFLLLQKKYDGKQMLVPSLRIDEIWHAHILFTKQYHEDCQKLFGKYMHHQPETQFGRYQLSKNENEKAADETERVYLQEYNEYIYGKPIYVPAIIEPLVRLILNLGFIKRAFV